MSLGARRGLMSATIVCAALALVCGVVFGSFYLARWIMHSAPATPAVHAPDWFLWAIAIAFMALLMRNNDRTVTLSYEDRAALKSIARSLEVIADELRRRA